MNKLASLKQSVMLTGGIEIVPSQENYYATLRQVSQAG